MASEVQDKRRDQVGRKLPCRADTHGAACFRLPALRAVQTTFTGPTYRLRMLQELGSCIGQDQPVGSADEERRPYLFLKTAQLMADRGFGSIQGPRGRGQRAGRCDLQKNRNVFQVHERSAFSNMRSKNIVCAHPDSAE